MFFLAISNLMATEAYSQTARLTMHLEDATVKEVLSKIEDNSEFFFLYNGKLVDVNRKVSVDANDEKISEILSGMFRETDVCWSVVDRQIVLTDKANQNSFANIGSQQSQKVTGTVTDEKGSPLGGVTVIVKGTTLGALTDVSGKYIINNSPKDATLVFSFIGMETQEIAANGRVLIDVVLKEVSIGLDEVVVIGYGTQKKQNVSGAIEVISSKDMIISNSSSFQQTLQGKVAGLQVTQPTGQPGADVSLQLRSNPSFANAGVLYVVDGVPVNDNAGIPSSAYYGTTGVSQSPLNFINPDDIESISFLKDASSASIYGARAGAGVVLIVTKRGKSGKPKIQYSGSYAFQHVDKMYDLLDCKDYMIQRNLISQEKWMLDNQIAPYYGTVDQSTVSPFVPIYSQSAIDNQPNYPSPSKAITRAGFTQQNNLSISGGNDKTTYFISFNSFDQKGVIINSGYQRYNGRINLDQVISNKLKIGTNIIISNSITDNIPSGGRNENSGIISATIDFPPIIPLKDKDGNYPLNPYFGVVPNPLSYETITDVTNNLRLITNAYAEWQVIKGLKAKANFSYDQSGNKRSSFYPTQFLYGTTTNGLAAIGETSSHSKLLEYTLNYNKSIGEKNSFDALAGYSYQLTNNDGVNAGNQNFVSNSISYYNLAAGQATTPTVGSYKSQTTWASYFARAIMQFDTKYILQASVRRDGSSAFAQNKKWGLFPSVSAGWIMSDENFIKKISLLSYLKLRVGYGETGNSAFPGTADAVYGIGSGYVFGQNSPSTSVSLIQAANPNLTWETAGELNVGFDFGILKNRIRGSVDFFRKTIRNLIAWTPFASDFVVSGVYSNAGKTRSTGYDISLTSSNIEAKSIGGFTWTTNITFSHYLSYWVQRSPLALETLPKYEYVTGPKAVFNPIYGEVADGIFTGVYGTAPSTMPNMLPGGIILKDIHGYDEQGNLTGPDGKITSADQTYLGNWDPKFNFGIGNTFTYKGFDLTIFLSGQKKLAYDPYGPKMLSRFTEVWAVCGVQGQNMLNSIKNRWTFQNPDRTTRPTGLTDPLYYTYQGNYESSNPGSSYWYIDGSYLRCKNLTLGYSLPDRLIVKTKYISAIRVYVDCQNLFTITKYPGLDPELDQYNFYPLTKTFVFGLNVTF
jgi:TonB-linked SusC/RagA family outer membrane protein